MATVVTAHKIPSSRKHGRYEAVIMAEMSDGSLQDVLTFYDDEIQFSADETIGLTSAQCGDLFHKRDIAYLQS